MAITSTTNKVTYTGNAVASVFPYAFKIFANTEIEVDKILISTQEVETLTLTTDYTVSGVGESTGGNVTLTAGALSALYKLTIKRVLPLTQLVDFIENDSAPAETFEQAYDRDTMIAQQLQETVDRCLKMKVYSTGITVEIPDPDANYYLGWNSDGTALENKIAISLGDADLDTDGTLAANSDTRVASQKATKTYVDTNIEVNTETAKTAPVSADIALIEDSAATWARKKVTLANITKGLSPNTLTTKATPVGADEIIIGDTEASNVAKKATIASLTSAIGAATITSVYPVGSIYISTVSTNPATTFGIGTWVAFGAGRVLLGNGGGYTAGDTGGAATHALSIAELAAHTHTFPTYDTNPGGLVKGALTGSVLGTVTTSSTGSGTAHNNLQPYIVVYIWQRTA